MQQVILTSRPHGLPGPDNFALVEAPDPDLPEGGVVVETLFASVDPAMRGWVSDEANYMDPVKLGGPMRSLGVGRIVASDLQAWQVDDMLYGWTGWRTRAALRPADILWRVDSGLAPPEAWLSVLGLNGLTAIKGMTAFARARAGETLLVTTAAGGVGSLVGQLGKAAGSRVVGLTSGAEKCRLAETLFGYDVALDYRDTTDLPTALKAACPSGIDIFWDNVGGPMADAIFPLMATGGRIIQCGTASIPSWIPWPDGPRRERAVLVKRLSWHGFVALDGDTAATEILLDQLKALINRGLLRHQEDIRDGLAAAPVALAALYAGSNLGRICIRV